jgi:hypothetical protein
MNLTFYWREKIMKTAIEQYDTFETFRDKKNYFEACFRLMDKELSDTLMVNLPSEESVRGFLVVYSAMHQEKFNEEFVCG